MCVRTQLLQSCLTLCDPMDCSPLGSSDRGDSPDKNTGVGYPALLQGIFPTQGSSLQSPTSPALQADSLLPEPTGKPIVFTELPKEFSCIFLDFYFLRLSVLQNAQVGFQTIHPDA